MKNLLIIDDDQALGRSLQLQLQLQGLAVEVRPTGSAGLSALAQQHFDALFLDLKLPDMSGLTILQQARATYPDLPVIIISGRQDMEATIDAIKFGAFDYIRKPLDMDSLLLAIEKLKFQEQKQARTPEKNTPPPEFSSRELVGNTPEMLEVLKQIGLLSRSRLPVLILGESGTGKELVARALHKAASQDNPFVAINCSAVVPTLLESELFGHEKGAFTGADRQKIGKLEAASEGSVFFDEIGDMPLDLQAKLLRVLQEGEFDRVGGASPIAFRARAIFATHRDLSEMVTAGTFRQDLYYRIAVARLTLPPLRSRKDDIEAIATYLLHKISRSEQTQVRRLLPEAVARLRSHDWPGNVRELENVLARATALSYSETLIPEDLVFEESPRVSNPTEAQPARTLAAAEKEFILQSLLASGWNITQTARLLDISPTTLRKKIADYQLSTDPAK